MNKTLASIPLMIVGLIATVGAGVAAAADADPWAPCRFLLGEWTGEGQGGAGAFTFGFDLEGKVLVRRNRADFPVTLDRAGVMHRDLMVIHLDERTHALRATYWDNEGHMIPYAVTGTPDRKSLEFLSDAAPDRPRFRLTYAAESDETVAIDFATSQPGKPEEFRPHLHGKARRTPRSAIGLDIPKGYVAHRVGRPLDIDGRLDEADWRTAPWTDPFVDIEGDMKPRPRFRTRAKMLWDDTYFYVAALVEEPHIWGTLTKHDSVIFQDNDFEVFIDPDGDNLEYYEVEINVLNTEWDLFLRKPYRDGGPAINEWEIPGLKTGVHVAGTLNNPSDTDQYWSVEFAFPWKVMAEYAHRPSPPKDGDQWRINFSRVEWRHEVVDGKYRRVPNTREDNWVWSAQGYIDMHKPEYWGFVQFSDAPPGTAAFRPDPASPIRDRLIDLYYAQSAFRGKNKKVAERLEDLVLPKVPPHFPDHTISIRPTPDGYEADITFNPSQAGPQTWTIRQDSRIVRKP